MTRLLVSGARFGAGSLGVLVGGPLDAKSILHSRPRLPSSNLAQLIDRADAKDYVSGKRGH